MSDAVARRPWGRALVWLALLGPFFFLSYGYANSVAAQRVGVPSVVFDWEHAIPFWAWTIVPYWSIDLFYGISLFVCRDRRELDNQALRLLTAQLIAIACFLAFPLTFSFVRPQTEGAFGWMFDVLLGFDKPFNQAPSLHIVLLIVLWVRFAQHLGGVWRWLLHLWFGLIGLSVLTTYQHHFIDVPTGLLAGWLCVWLWPEGARSPWRATAWARDRARWRLAALYLAGAVLCAALAWALGGAAWWLLWPALSLLLVAANYGVLGADGFQKRADGRLTPAARWLFAPYLWGAWLNSRLWTRRAPRPVEIADGVWLGRMPGRGEAAGFALVDVCAELSAPAGLRPVAVRPMLDLVVPEPATLRAVAQDIEAARASGPVLVCCALGYSRSAAAVAAWLLYSGRADGVEAALARVRAARPAVVLGDAHGRALQASYAEQAITAAPLGAPAA
ncbi:phosphatase PAP2/dual specificity phosphatase family protein [Lysobacter sp. 5GHs7-4]|uniref:phosphatase PAP2/dual specificity phosphatase family protein n=1 Tax=Lysobacter sp. 5GHs7-4 TaxID=2904253 RepID=UPI001E44BECE|nr:phosphatase PAP2/dual specificity phosphatase family protein [Lysobacter sp. 5GHs7-4]UHQ24025.1 phosphatase PAP2/dual specificity phosphatase family protein [Lysobacter sp. 5GHs7-4]